MKKHSNKKTTDTEKKKNAKNRTKNNKNHATPKQPNMS